MLQPDIQQSTSGTFDENNSPQVTSSEPTIRHCYGTEMKTSSDCPWVISLQINRHQFPNYINCPRKRCSLKHYVKHFRKMYSTDFMPGGRKTILYGTPVFLMAPVDGTRLPDSRGGHKDFH